jgi:hypothetical protein
MRIHSRQLLTINAAAMYSLPDYTGHLLDDVTRNTCIDTLKVIVQAIVQSVALISIADNSTLLQSRPILLKPVFS